MFLNRIAIYAPHRSSYEREFNLETHCPCEMFFFHLGKIETKNLGYLNINLVPSKDEVIVQKWNGSFLTVYQVFDFENYFQLNNLGKKKCLLKIVYDNMISICTEQEIDRSTIDECYETCLSQKNIEHRWILRKSYKRSPNHKYYGNVECYWDLDKFTASAIILNKNKEQILKKELLNLLPHRGEQIYYSKIGWSLNDFYIESKYGDKVKMNVLNEINRKEKE